MADNYKQISLEFRRALRSISFSDNYVTCACGKVYDSDSDDEYDDGEFWECVRLEGSKVHVIDCDCNGLRRYEDWFRRNRDLVLDFYSRLLEAEASEVKSLHSQLKNAGVQLPPLFDPPIRQIDLSD